MLRSFKGLHQSNVYSTDGAIGRLVDFFFDDQTWTVRYLLVDVSDWLGGQRTVYISPLAVAGQDWDGKRVDLSFSREQVSDSPGLRDGILLSRQSEAGYYEHHGWPYYWTGPARWGAWDTPAEAAAAPRTARPYVETGAPGLRSASAVSSYPVQATDGHLGRVEDFLMDEANWGIEKIELDTTRWWPGGEVMITPAQVTRLDWSEHHLYVSLSRAELKSLAESGPSK